MLKDRPILLTLAVLALAATLIMPNVISVLAPNPAETTPTESLTSPTDSLTWTTTQVVSTVSTLDSVVPSLGVGSDGTIHVAWEDGPYSYQDVVYRRWDPLLGWITTEVVSTESTEWSGEPSLGVGSDGTVHVAWTDFTDYGGAGTDRDIFYKRWVPLLGWTTTEVVSTESNGWSYYPSLAVGSDGTVNIAWQDPTDYGGAGGGEFDIFYKRWETGTGWTTTEVVSTESTDDSEWPSLAVGPDGTVNIAWEDDTDYGGAGTDSDIFYKVWVPATGWRTTSVVSWESTVRPERPSLAVGPDGQVHVAWEDWSNYGGSDMDPDIFYKAWEVVGGWPAAEVVSTESTSYSLSPSLAVGPDGAVHIAWYDDTDYGGSGGDMDVFYRKGERANVYFVVRGLNDRVYYRTCASGVWGGWNVVPAGTTRDSPAAAVYAGKLYMVVRGLDGNSLWYGWVDLADDSFSGWKWMSGSTPSKPTLTRWGSTLILVVRGKNNRIYYRAYSTFLDTWGDWNSVPTGTTCDSPAATVDGLSLHLVVRGKTGHGLYYQSFGLIWPVYPGWTLISGDTPSAPTLATNYRDEGDIHYLRLVVRGMNDGIYWGTWVPYLEWSDLPGATIDAIGATIQPPHPRPGAMMHFIVRGKTGGLYHGLFDLNSWAFLGWTLIDGDTPSPPTLTS